MSTKIKYWIAGIVVVAIGLVSGQGGITHLQRSGDCAVLGLFSRGAYRHGRAGNCPDGFQKSKIAIL